MYMYTEQLFHELVLCVHVRVYGHLLLCYFALAPKEPEEYFTPALLSRYPWHCNFGTRKLYTPSCQMRNDESAHIEWEFAVGISPTPGTGARKDRIRAHGEWVLNANDIKYSNIVHVRLIHVSAVFSRTSDPV